MKGKLTKGNFRGVPYAALISASLLFTGFSGALVAQEESASRMEEVIVTARKREESMQDVPVAVTALTPAQLDKGNIQRVQDLQKLIPNVRMHDMAFAGGALSASIRGMTYDDLEKSFEPAVPIVIDGVVGASNAGVDLDLFDLEAVEVLRGPQGTLFGRNTIGGVINIKRTQPTGEWGLKIGADIEEDNTTEFKLVANMPLGENGGVKIALRELQSDSFMYNVTRNERLKLRDLESASISIASNLGDNLYANLTVDYYNDNSAHNLINLTPAAWGFCAGFGHCESNDDASSSDYTQTFQREPFYSGIAGLNYTLNMKYEGDGFTIKSITAQNDFEELMDICSWGGSGTAVGFLSDRPAGTYPTWRSDANCVFPVVRDQEYEQRSQEFQFISNLDGPLNYTVGLYYLEAETMMDSGPIQNFIAEHELEARAIFADVVYDLNEDWSVNFGIRYTEEDKALNTRNFATYTGKTSGANIGAYTGGYSDDNITYRFILERNTSFGMIYGGVTTGYRSGGFQMRGVGGYVGGENATDTPQDYGPYNSEDVTSMEIGIRSELNDGRVIMNLTAFRADYEEKQETVVNGGFAPCNPTCTFVLNAGEVEITGYEFEAKAMVLDNLIVNASVGILDADYKTFDYLGQDISGESEVLWSPDLTMNIGFEHTQDIWGGELQFSGSLNFADDAVGRYTPIVSATAGLDMNVESYEQLDLSVTYIMETSTGSTFRFTVFGNDILEEGGRISRPFDAAPTFTFASPLKRQHFGMKIGYEF